MIADYQGNMIAIHQPQFMTHNFTRMNNPFVNVYLFVYVQ